MSLTYEVGGYYPMVLEQTDKGYWNFNPPAPEVQAQADADEALKLARAAWKKVNELEQRLMTPAQRQAMMARKAPPPMVEEVPSINIDDEITAEDLPF